MVKQYKNAKNEKVHPFQQVSFLLNRCIHCMGKVMESIDGNDPAQKVIWVDKIIVILMTLGEIFDLKEKAETNPAIEEWTQYLENTVYLISIVNRNNDLNLAKSLIKSFGDMAETWIGFYEKVSSQQSFQKDFSLNSEGVSIQT